MTSIVQPALVLVDPVSATGVAVEARRWALPLLLIMLCSAAAGTAFALRWEAGPAVVRQLQQSDKLEKMTESEITEEIETAWRRAVVGGVARGLLFTPLMVLALAAMLWLCGWLLETRAPFGSLFCVAVLALLPLALNDLIFTVCALAQYSLTEQRMAELVPSNLAVLEGLSPQLKQALRAVDFFRLWSVALLGLGFSAATGMRRGRALLLAAVLYVAYTGVFNVGLPGMMSGMQGGGR
jgi:hypothetical protein